MLMAFQFLRSALWGIIASRVQAVQRFDVNWKKITRLAQLLERIIYIILQTIAEVQYIFRSALICF